VRSRERCSRARAHDPVGDEVHTPLKANHRRFRPRAEVSVERAAVPTSLAQQELNGGDVEPEVAALDRPVAEQWVAERPERAARPRVDRSRDRQPESNLCRTHGRSGLRADDAVDRAEVEPECSERDLDPCLLRARSGRDDRRACPKRERHTEDPPRTHGLKGFRSGLARSCRAAASLWPVWRLYPRNR
jgi:hypothetical protein